MFLFLILLVILRFWYNSSISSSDINCWGIFCTTEMVNGVPANRTTIILEFSGLYPINGCLSLLFRRNPTPRSTILFLHCLSRLTASIEHLIVLGYRICTSSSLHAAVRFLSAVNNILTFQVPTVINLLATLMSSGFSPVANMLIQSRFLRRSRGPFSPRRRPSRYIESFFGMVFGFLSSLAFMADASTPIWQTLLLYLGFGPAPTSAGLQCTRRSTIMD